MQTSEPVETKEAITPEHPAKTTPIVIVTGTPEPRSSVTYTNETYPPMEFPITKEERARTASEPQREPLEIFRAAHTLRYTNIALVAEIEHPPFHLEFTTSAESRNPYYSFLIVTVRDADTKEVIAEDGYGRKYSSEKTKELIFYRKGRYHINIYGNMVKVDLAIKTMDVAPAKTTPVSRVAEEYREII